MRSASSTDACELPSWFIAMKRRPVPLDVFRFEHCGADCNRPSYTTSEMKRQTSGCILQVCSRNNPRSDGIVESVPRRCSRTEDPEVPGYTAVDTCASCSG